MAPSTPRSSLGRLPGSGLLSDEVELGRVTGVFGFRGELRVHLHSAHDSVLLRQTLPVVLIATDGTRRSAELRCRPGAGKRILGRLTGVEDEATARALMGTRFAVRRDELPEPDDGEFYVADLQGLTVITSGQARGRVVDVASTPAGDLLELEIDGEIVFIPFSGPAVLDIDLGRGELVVDPDALVEP